MSDNDTIELVRHLRAMARYEHGDMTIAADAADEIERLRARVAELEYAYSKCLAAAVGGVQQDGGPS
jgi:hypothetical protein